MSSLSTCIVDYLISFRLVCLTAQYIACWARLCVSNHLTLGQSISWFSTRHWGTFGASLKEIKWDRGTPIG